MTAISPRRISCRIFPGSASCSGISFGRLGFGQIFQDAFSDTWRGPQTLERGDDAIAAKHGAEPGHSRVGIGAFGIALDEHAEIGG